MPIVQTLWFGSSDQSDYLVDCKRKAVLDVGLSFHAPSRPQSETRVWYGLVRDILDQRLQAERRYSGPNAAFFLQRAEEAAAKILAWVELHPDSIFVSGYPLVQEPPAGPEKKGRVTERSFRMPPGMFPWEDAQGFLRSEWTGTTSEASDWSAGVMAGLRSRYTGELREACPGQSPGSGPVQSV